MQKQLALILGRQQVFLDLDGDVDEMADLSEIMSNAQLNTNFLSLARYVGMIFRDEIFVICIRNWVLVPAVPLFSVIVVDADLSKLDRVCIFWIPIRS